MKVVIIYQYYQGHGAPGHSLVYELTQYLAQQGHHVSVVSGETGYMKTDVPSAPWYRRIIRRDKDGLVNVVRTHTYSELHRSYFGRLLSFISFSLSCPIGMFATEKPDIVLASSPPIFPMFSAYLVCKFRRTPFILEVRDLWPASAVQMGLLNNKILISIMAWMERRLYNKSHKIVAMTEGIRDDICSRGWEDKKVALVTCGIDSKQLYPDVVGRDLIRSKYGWKDKKIVMYFGALGEANNMPVILRAAQRLKNSENILFVLIGDGMKRSDIEQLKAEMKLDNMLVLPPVPKEDARLFINSADLCLVTLRNIPLFKGAIPTKLIDYLACGKPVLCGIQGEAKKIVDESGAGLTFDSDNDQQLGELILKMLGDDSQLSIMGAKGSVYAQQKFSILKMQRRMEKILQDAVKDHSCRGSAERPDREKT